MNILETKISTFKSTRSTEVNNESVDTIGVYLNFIKNGHYKASIDKVRAGDKAEKLKLPTIAFHGIFDGFREKKKFIEASGIVILDIDDVEDDMEDVKEDIMDGSENVLAVMISPSGDGIKVLYYVQPDIITADNYREIGKQLVSKFDMYGKVDYLSVTDCLIVTYDPNILINENVEPAFLYIKETTTHTVELEPLDVNRVLWDDPEDFFDTVLATDIEQKTNSNFHYIQVGILDLAKFGFTHPKEDLSFVIDYAESAFKSSSDNKKRFLEVVEVAKQYGQTKWPYKTIRSDDDEDDEGYMDYSNYTTTSSSTSPSSPAVSSDVVNEEESTDGLVNYDTLYDCVRDVVKEGNRVGCETSLADFADIFRFKGTGILTVTGIPGHGKTEFVDACIVDLARLYGHETIVVGYEQRPEEHIIKLIRKMVGVDVTCPSYFNKDTEPEFDAAYKFVTEHIKHIETTKVGGNINDILEIASQQIKKSRDAGGDPRYIVLDPFNMLSIKGKFSGHEKIEEILRRLTHFSHQMGVLVILIAHPFKMRIDEKTEKYAVPDFYSVKGSSAFFEMSYHGLVVYREGYKASDPVMIKVLKVKQNNLGVAGENIHLRYDRPSGRYIPIDNEDNEGPGDHREKNWTAKIK